MKKKIIAIFHKHHDPWEETHDGDKLPGHKYEEVADEIVALYNTGADPPVDWSDIDPVKWKGVE